MKVIDVVEILEHWHAGRKMVELSALARGGPKDGAQVRRPGAGGRARPRWAGLEQASSGRRWPADWFPELADRSSLPVDVAGDRRTPQSRSRVARRGVTVSTIHQRLRDNHGLAASESSLRRWINANLAEEASPQRRRGVARHPAGRRGGPGGLRTAWVAGSIRIPSAGGGCGASSWCWPSPGSCSCARCSRWTSAPGSRLTSRPSSSSAASRCGSCRTTSRPG